jgi:DNA ligase-associated metallophosphoesterase
VTLTEPAHRYAFARHPLGGLAISLADASVVCLPSGALWLQQSRVLVAADLHLEKGSAFAARGQMLPPYDSRDTLARLEAEAVALSPSRIVLLGDTFHDPAAEGRLAEPDARRLAALAADAALTFVTGNHDPAGMRHLPGAAVARVEIDGLTLVHEPTPEPTVGEVAGHLHPCARLRGYAMSLRRRCFITDGERIIVPAFGAFTGGLNVRDPAFGRLFRRRPLAVFTGDAGAHPVAWASLGAD